VRPQAHAVRIACSSRSLLSLASARLALSRAFLCQTPPPISISLTGWAGQGLNLRQPACKASALPLSYPPDVPDPTSPGPLTLRTPADRSSPNASAGFPRIAAPLQPLAAALRPMSRGRSDRAPAQRQGLHSYDATEAERGFRHRNRRLRGRSQRAGTDTTGRARGGRRGGPSGSTPGARRPRAPPATHPLHVTGPPRAQ
jgi:hypothetical protein